MVFYKQNKYAGSYYSKLAKARSLGGSKFTSGKRGVPRALPKGVATTDYNYFRNNAFAPISQDVHDMKRTKTGTGSMYRTPGEWNELPFMSGQFGKRVYRKDGTSYVNERDPIVRALAPFEVGGAYAARKALKGYAYLRGTKVY